MATEAERPSPKRGAAPSPQATLAAASPFQIKVGAPPQFLKVADRLSFWGNEKDGDCVTAEEASRKGATIHPSLSRTTLRLDGLGITMR